MERQIKKRATWQMYFFWEQPNLIMEGDGGALEGAQEVRRCICMCAAQAILDYSLRITGSISNMCLPPKLLDGVPQLFNEIAR